MYSLRSTVSGQVSLEREARLNQHWEWRGNRLAPFNIEPLPRERERLAGAGMTVADRASRRQWLADQELSHHEPRFIAALYPKNPIRRALAAPWNGVFAVLKPILVRMICVIWNYSTNNS